MKMKRTMIVVSVLLVLAMCFGLMAGCGKKEEEVIRIGTIQPLTGGSANAGIDQKWSYEMAVKEINDAGGINGVKVELYSEDDGSVPSQSATAATKLITQNNIDVLIGAHNSSCTMACMEVVSRYNIPEIAPTSTAVTVTQQGNPWISRGSAKDSLQANALITYISENFPEIKKVGMIYVNDEVGLSGNAAITEACGRVGIEIVSASFATEDTDMTVQVSQMKAENVDGLIVWCEFSPGAIIMKQARAMNWDVQFFGYTGTMDQDMFELSDWTFVGCINTVPFIPTSDAPNIQDFVERYTAFAGYEPSQAAARSYDAIQIVFEAIRKAGYKDKEALQKAIRNTTDYAGLQGNITIRPEDGEFLGDVMVVRALETGKWEMLQYVEYKGGA